ncbi:MAG: hypothetical protein RI957_95 [Verrucomicrobiota bacterium]|jgi:hypothetical protein
MTDDTDFTDEKAETGMKEKEEISGDGDSAEKWDGRMIHPSAKPCNPSYYDPAS